MRSWGRRGSHRRCGSVLRRGVWQRDDSPARTRPSLPLPGERSRHNARLGQTNTSARPWTLPRGRRVPQGERSQEAAGLGLFLPPHTHLALPTACTAVTAGISFALLGLHCRHLLGTLLVCAGGKRQRELKTFLGRRGGRGVRGHTGGHGQGRQESWAEAGGAWHAGRHSGGDRVLLGRWREGAGNRRELPKGSWQRDRRRRTRPSSRPQLLPTRSGHSLAPVEVLPGPPLSLPHWPGSTPPAPALCGSTPEALCLPCPRDSPPRI